ncbi:MAG: chemotaxis protein CheB [Deltaproteobacteria bacterium]|nr:MAG: chemotaxis protein CheB [Deltaproteobacteria bacterium]
MRADRASGSRTRRSGYSVLPTVRSAQSPSRCASAPLPCRARPVDRPIDTRLQSTISAVVRAAEPAGRDCSLAPAADEGFIAYQGAAFDAVAIGASAGGVTALQAVIGALPARFPAAVFVVQHLDPRHKSLLADLLGRHAQMAVKEAVNGERIEPGTVYIAPPDTHLLVANGHISLTSSELVHFTRPSVDLLFESVAAAYRDRAIGVILTGSGLDGATGIRAIKEQGGTTIVQDPADALHPSMPSNAYATGCVDFKLRLDDVGPAIVRLVLESWTTPAEDA